MNPDEDPLRPFVAVEVARTTRDRWGRGWIARSDFCPEDVVRAWTERGALRRIGRVARERVAGG